MEKKKNILFFVLLISPVVKCNLEGLNIQRGSCPTFTTAQNMINRVFSGTWIVVQRSTNFVAGPKDCETHLFQFDQNNNLRLTIYFDNLDSEFGRAFIGTALQRAPGQFTFRDNRFRNNYILRGTYSILATDNINFAITALCYEYIGYRFITVWALVNTFPPPANFQDRINQVLAQNPATNPPLRFTNQDQKCVIRV